MCDVSADLVNGVGGDGARGSRSACSRVISLTGVAWAKSCHRLGIVGGSAAARV